MSLSDPVADTLARIKNALGRNHESVVCLSSSLNKAILEVLKAEGYIESYEETPVKENIIELTVKLKYYNGKPAIKYLKRVSKPGRRVYSSIEDLKPIYNGLGHAVLSTSKGVISDSAARSLKVGGEILFEVY